MSKLFNKSKRLQKIVLKCWNLNHSIPVVNLNSNRTCPGCTGLPDNSVYYPDPMVQYVALTKHIFLA